MKFLRSQPTAVWAVAAAAVVSFMGLGLVDPILPAIARGLRASPSDVELLFTSYFAVTGLAMLVSGVVASLIGTKRTLLVGLALIVVFSALAGLSNSVGAIVGLRAGWGLGNALFIATALSVIAARALQDLLVGRVTRGAVTWRCRWLLRGCGRRRTRGDGRRGPVRSSRGLLRVCRTARSGLRLVE